MNQRPPDDPAERSEFIRGPRWRVTAAPSRRRTAAWVTFATVVVVGVVPLAFTVWLLARLDAPGWLVLAPWWLPTLGLLAWTLIRPRPAVAANDEQAWVTYAVCSVLFGADETRPAPARVIIAVVFGGPTVWALALIWLFAIIGLAEV